MGDEQPVARSALMEWTWNDEDRTWTVLGRQCVIWLSQRPHYCDRGNWLAHIQPSGTLRLDMDAADLWPRYYFDLDRAKAEIEAWLIKRGEEVGPPARS
jgi:hypothetical protein